MLTGVGSDSLRKSRPEFWEPKLRRNTARDREKAEALRRRGWQVLTVWQCETRQPEMLKNTLVEFLGPAGTKKSIDFEASAV